MFIGKLAKCDRIRTLFTQEEKALIKNILDEFQAAMLESEPQITEISPPEELSWYEFVANPFMEKMEAIHKVVKLRYILSFNGDAAAILSDVQNTLNVIKKEDFTKAIETLQKIIPNEKVLLHSYDRIKDPVKKKEAIENIPAVIMSRREAATANYSNCYNFLLSNLDDQIAAIRYYNLSLSDLEELVIKKCSEWYPKPKTDIFPKISTSKLQDILYPIDKVNSELWNCFSIGENTPLKAESDKDSRKGKQANIYVMLDFNELDGVKISRPLTSFDQRAFVAISNIRESGQEIATLSQIYEAMGGESRASAQIRSKIIESIETMSRAVVKIDTTEENRIYPRLDKIVWESQLLHIEKIKGYSRGQITDYAIRIIEVPKLFLFAKNRGQITTVPIKLLESDISKTEANLLLENYLLSRIARMRNSTKITRTILIETVHQKCNIKTACQRQRLPEKIEKYLKHYVSVGWIKAYKLTDKSIEIVTYSV